MDHHQNPSQQNQNQLRRRPAEAAAAGSQNQPHPPPQPCPRCNSNNTKFCYYNNYSLAQPRYFCKGCRRYWTHGGTLRNVPVGGGSRKRKRPKLSSSATATATATATTTTSISSSLQEPTFGHHQLNSTSSLSQNPSSFLGTPISGATGFYGGGGGGGGGGGFLSSLAGMTAVNFGPNLGLLHGLGLTNLDHQEPMSFQQLFQQHHHQSMNPGGLSTLGTPPSLSGDWILSNSNNNTNNGSTNNNHDNNDPNQWPQFQVGNTGLEDP